MTTTKTLVDPWVNARVDQYVSESPGYDDPVTGFYVRGRRCVESEDGTRCTRPYEHPESWQHIACGSSYIIRTWGGADPFADIEVGQNVREHPLWKDSRRGVRVREINWCGAPTGTPGHFCTRPRDHEFDWKHVSTSYQGDVLGVKINNIGGPYVETVPADGSAVDPPERVFTTAPGIGEIVKLRDRQRELYVIDVTASGDVETLDLDDLNYRIIPVDHLVYTERTLSVSDLPRLENWFNQHRHTVRRVGIEKMRQNLWCRDGLDSALKKMGLPKFEPELRGTISVQLPFLAGDGTMTRSDAQARVLALFEDPRFRELLNEVPDVEPEWGTATAHVNDLHRS